mgnify:CR=1 FL=1
MGFCPYPLKNVRTSDSCWNALRFGRMANAASSLGFPKAPLLQSMTPTISDSADHRDIYVRDLKENSIQLIYRLMKPFNRQNSVWSVIRRVKPLKPGLDPREMMQSLWKSRSKLDRPTPGFADGCKFRYREIPFEGFRWKTMGKRNDEKSRFALNPYGKGDMMGSGLQPRWIIKYKNP